MFPFHSWASEVKCSIKIPVAPPRSTSMLCKGYSEKLMSNHLNELHPWLLSKGNCLRTQMMQFCDISNEIESKQWNYQGGNIEMLMKMVDLNGGYTLVPSNYVLSFEQSKNLHSIHATSSDQSDSIELLIRQIQHEYAINIESNKFQLLGWE